MKAFMQFLALVPFITFGQTFSTGWVSPNSFPTATWTNPQNTYSSDNLYCSRTKTGGTFDSQVWNSFGFTLPSEALITGIEVSIEHKNTHVAADIRLGLRISGSNSTMRPSVSVGISDAVYIIGSSNYTFGFNNLLGSDVNNSFELVVYQYYTGMTTIEYIDELKVRIHFLTAYEHPINSISNYSEINQTSKYSITNINSVNK